VTARVNSWEMWLKLIRAKSKLTQGIKSVPGKPNFTKGRDPKTARRWKIILARRATSCRSLVCDRAPREGACPSDIHPVKELNGSSRGVFIKKGRIKFQMCDSRKNAKKLHQRSTITARSRPPKTSSINKG